MSPKSPTTIKYRRIATAMIDSATKLCENRVHIFDPVGLINDSYYASHGTGARRSTRSSDGGSSPLRFAVEVKVDGGDSDASSPRLWKTSPAGSPPPETSDSHQQPMSPNSRAQAIARGRKELMEMIKDLPESFYELSLRDIVDQKSQIYPPPPDDEKRLAPMEDAKDRKEKTKKKVKKTISRSRSADNGGYLLKTSVFPISFGLKRNKKTKKQKESSFSTPAAMATKSAEKEWWRRRKSSEESSDSSGGLSSSNSGSSSRSSSRSSSTSSRRGRSSRFLAGCCSFRNK